MRFFKSQYFFSAINVLEVARDRSQLELAERLCVLFENHVHNLRDNVRPTKNSVDKVTNKRD